MIVKKIFKDFLAGKSIGEIMNELINEKVPTPSQYRGVKNTQKIITGAWNATTIRRILKSEIYIGNIIQNRKQKISYKVKKQISTDKSDWIKVENVHEPIISLEDFEQVQQIFKKRAYVPKTGEAHLFTGFLFCDKCGSRLTYRKSRHTPGEYECICNISKTYRKFGYCDMLSIREKDIIDCVKQVLSSEAQKHINLRDISNSLCSDKLQYNIDLLKSEKKSINDKLENSIKLKLEMFKSKVNGDIDENTFTNLINEIEKEEKIFENRKIEINDEINKFLDTNKNMNKITTIIKQFLEFQELDRITLSYLLDKIILYKDNNTCKIKIKTTFSDEIHVSK